MILRIESDSPVPPYEQIRAQVATMVASGVLPAGMRLPAIRQLSKDLGVAGGTVARAYRELETEGVITPRGHQGTFVTATDGKGRQGASQEVLAEAAMAFAVRARQLGTATRSALKMAREALESIDRTTEKHG